MCTDQMSSMLHETMRQRTVAIVRALQSVSDKDLSSQIDLDAIVRERVPFMVEELAQRCPLTFSHGGYTLALHDLAASECHSRLKDAIRTSDMKARTVDAAVESVLIVVEQIVRAEPAKWNLPMSLAELKSQ